MAPGGLILLGLAEVLSPKTQPNRARASFSRPEPRILRGKTGPVPTRTSYFTRENGLPTGFLDLFAPPPPPRPPGSPPGGQFGAPQGSPGGSRERPGSARRAPGAPQEAQSEPQEAQNEPQEGQSEPKEAENEPQAAQDEPQESLNELREVPGGFRERFCKDFRRIYKQRGATETLRDFLEKCNPSTRKH